MPAIGRGGDGGPCIFPLQEYALVFVASEVLMKALFFGVAMAAGANASAYSEALKFLFASDADDVRAVAADEKIPATTGPMAPFAGTAWWQADLLCNAHYDILAGGPDANYPAKAQPMNPDAMARGFERRAIGQLMRDRHLTREQAIALLGRTQSDEDLASMQETYKSRLYNLVAMKGGSPFGEIHPLCIQFTIGYTNAHPGPLNP